jgi:zinc protease
VKRTIAALWFVLALFAPAVAGAVTVKNLDMGKDVQVWYVEDHTLPMISMSAALPAGSAYDPKAKAGLAAFTADLLNEGAGNLRSQAYQGALSDKAIKLSVTTERDYMVISLVTLSENAKDAFHLLGMALSNPRFDGDAVNRVRTQILSAIAEENEDPTSVAGKGFFTTYFKEHPYAHPVNGDPGSVARITRNDIRAFQRSHWVKNGLRLTVSGDANADQLKALIASAFGQLPAKWAPPVPAAQHAGAPGVHVIPMPVPQPVMVFAVPGLLRNDRDFIPGYVANYILGGGGFSSRLMNEVREKRGLTYNISTSLDAFRKAGIVAGDVATRAGAMRQTIDVLRATMKDFVANGATQKELDDAKTYLTGSFPLAFSSNVGISSQLNAFQRAGLPIDYIQKRNALINAVTLDDVKRVSQRLFSPDRLTMVIGGSLGGPAAKTTPMPGVDKPPQPAQPPAKPVQAATKAPAPKPPVTANTTAAKPKEQRSTAPAVAPATAPKH